MTTSNVVRGKDVKDMTTDELTPDLNFNSLFLADLRAHLAALGVDPVPSGATKPEVVGILRDALEKRQRSRLQQLAALQQQQQLQGGGGPQTDLAPPPRITSRTAQQPQPNSIPATGDYTSSNIQVLDPSSIQQQQQLSQQQTQSTPASAPITDPAMLPTAPHPSNYFGDIPLRPTRKLGIDANQGSNAVKTAQQALAFQNRPFNPTTTNTNFPPEFDGQTGGEEPEVFKMYLQSAEIGDAYSQMQIGRAFLTGTGGVPHDNRAAHTWFMKAASVGFAPAQVQVGVMLQDGLLLDGNNQKTVTEGHMVGKGGVAGIPEADLHAAADMYLRAADQGDLDGMTKLGRCYMNGWGVPKNEAMAVTWYKLAAKNGGARAQNQLGWCYWKGKGVEKDWQEAVHWYKLSAEQGHAEGQTNLGLAYLYGWAGPKDPCEAVNWFWRAAENGIATAALELGICIEKGLGVQKEPTKAVLWYKRAADLGYDRAQEKLGACFMQGTGVDKDLEEAVCWLQAAAEQNYYPAMGRLGLLYQKGGDGVEKDYTKAVYWFEKAMNLGCQTSKTNLAICYEHGHGVPKDAAMAIKLYTEAAAAGNSQAQNNLGFCYERGLGVPQNLKEADKLYKAAAAKDHPQAQSSLGGFIEHGVAGNEPDPAIAFKLYMSAAKRGDSSGLFKVGRCYELGIGVERDGAAAARYYKKAILQKHPAAMANYGSMLLNGQGIPGDAVEGVKFIHAAADLGNVKAMQMISRCYEQGVFGVGPSPVITPGQQPPQQQIVTVLAQDIGKARAWLERARQESERQNMIDSEIAKAAAQGLPTPQDMAAEFTNLQIRGS